MKPTHHRRILGSMLIALAAVLFTYGCAGDALDSPTAQEPVHKVRPTPAVDGVIRVRNTATTTFGDVVATATKTATGIDAVLKDSSGNVLATFVWNEADGTIDLASPGVQPISGPDDGQQPKLAGSTFAVYYYWRQVQAVLGNPKVSSDVAALPLDEGCDYFPDALENDCVKACCAAHDACWAANDCDGWSWIGAGSLQCIWCNIKVVGCIAACAVEAVIEIIGGIFGVH